MVSAAKLDYIAFHICVQARNRSPVKVILISELWWQKQALLEPEWCVRSNFRLQSIFEAFLLHRSHLSVGHKFTQHLPPPNTVTTPHQRIQRNLLRICFLISLAGSNQFWKRNDSMNLNQRRVKSNLIIGHRQVLYVPGGNGHGMGPLHCGSSHTSGGLLSSHVRAQILNKKTHAFTINAC